MAALAFASAKIASQIAAEIAEHERTNALHREAFAQGLRIHEAKCIAEHAYHRAMVRMANEQHKRKSLQSLYQHEERIDLEKRVANRDNIRDDWNQMAARAETVLIVNVLVLAVSFAMLIEGNLPESAPATMPVLMVTYFCAIATSICLLLTSVRFAMVLRFRVWWIITDEMRQSIRRMTKLDDDWHQSEKYLQCNRPKMRPTAFENKEKGWKVRPLTHQMRRTAAADLLPTRNAGAEYSFIRERPGHQYEDLSWIAGDAAGFQAQRLIARLSCPRRSRSAPSSPRGSSDMLIMGDGRMDRLPPPSRPLISSSAADCTLARGTMRADSQSPCAAPFVVSGATAIQDGQSIERSDAAVTTTPAASSSNHFGGCHSTKTSATSLCPSQQLAAASSGRVQDLGFLFPAPRSEIHGNIASAGRPRSSSIVSIGVRESPTAVPLQAPPVHQPSDTDETLGRHEDTRGGARDFQRKMNELRDCCCAPWEIAAKRLLAMGCLTLIAAACLLVFGRFFIGQTAPPNIYVFPADLVSGVAFIIICGATLVVLCGLEYFERRGRPKRRPKTPGGGPKGGLSRSDSSESLILPEVRASPEVGLMNWCFRRQQRQHCRSAQCSAERADLSAALLYRVLFVLLPTIFSGFVLATIVASRMGLRSHERADRVSALTVTYLELVDGSAWPPFWEPTRATWLPNRGSLLLFGDTGDAIEVSTADEGSLWHIDAAPLLPEEYRTPGLQWRVSSAGLWPVLEAFDPMESTAVIQHRWSTRGLLADDRVAAAVARSNPEIPVGQASLRRAAQEIGVDVEGVQAATGGGLILLLSRRATSSQVVAPAQFLARLRSNGHVEDWWDVEPPGPSSRWVALVLDHDGGRLFLASCGPVVTAAVVQIPGVFS